MNGPSRRFHLQLKLPAPKPPPPSFSSGAWQGLTVQAIGLPHGPKEIILDSVGSAMGADPRHASRWSTGSQSPHSVRRAELRYTVHISLLVASIYLLDHVDSVHDDGLKRSGVFSIQKSITNLTTWIFYLPLKCPATKRFSTTTTKSAGWIAVYQHLILWMQTTPLWRLHGKAIDCLEGVWSCFLQYLQAIKFGDPCSKHYVQWSYSIADDSALLWDSLLVGEKRLYLEESSTDFGATGSCIFQGGISRFWSSCHWQPSVFPTSCLTASTA